MYPFIVSGEKVLVYPYNNIKPEIGDIILLFNDEMQYVHRIVLLDNEKVITKGDLNVKIDDELPINNIIGYIKRVNDYSDENIILIKEVSKLSYDAGMYFKSNINLNREDCLNYMRTKKDQILSISMKVNYYDQ